MEFLGELERQFAATIYPNRVPIAIATILLLVGLAFVARRRRWDRVVRRHPRASIVALVAAVAIGGPAAWYLGSPLFLSTTVDEAPPVSAGDPAGSPGAGAVRLGTFAGTDEFHFGRGTAAIVESDGGGQVLRFEDFEVRNGPDLFVYLSPSADGYAEGAVELGMLKADRGNQNYELPAGLDAADFGSVVIWCRAFSVEFAIAPLAGG